jgi:hypothetical protein
MYVLLTKLKTTITKLKTTKRKIAQLSEQEKAGLKNR